MNKKALWITGAAVAAVVVVGGSAAAIAAAPARVVPLTPVTGTLAPSATPLAADADLAAATTAALAEVPGTVIDVDRDDDSSHAYEVDVRREDGSVVEVRLDSSFAVVSVREDDRDDDDRDDDSRTASPSASPTAAPVAGDADRAAAAALAHVGSGTVVEVKRDDDPGVAWEVEIEFADGEDVDVELDAALRVIEVK